MKPKPPKPDPSNLKAFATNAVTEIYETEPESNLPLSSERSVEDARDFSTENKK